MNRRSILGLSAIAALGLALSTGTAATQERSLKETILGTWSVTSIYDLYEATQKRNPWGDGMKGTFTFDSNGRFTQIFIGEKQPSMKSEDPRRADALALAFIGTYTVDEGNRVIWVRNERATNSIRDSAEQKWKIVATSSDAMTLVGATPRKDLHGMFVPHVEVRRAK
jgi:hypothetical protein